LDYFVCVLRNMDIYPARHHASREALERVEGAKRMTKAKFTAFDAADHIKTAEDAAHYLDAVLADGDASEIADAIGVVARSQGMAAIAEQSGLSRETLYRTLSEVGNPRLATLIGVLRAMGLRLSVAAA
jgi:probable addiction module antidote protein